MSLQMAIYVMESSFLPLVIVAVKPDDKR